MRVGGAAALPGYVSSHGGSVEKILDAAGLVAAEIREPQRWLEIDRLAILYESAADDLDDANFGLRFGLTVPLHTYGLVAYVILNAPTVETALNNLVRFTRHLAGPSVDSQLLIDGETARLEFAHATPRADRYRQYFESIAATLCVMMRALAGPEWRPSQVGFQHTVGAPSRLPEELLDSEIRFGEQRHSISFAASTLTEKVVTADRTLLPLFEEHVDRLAPDTGEDDAAAEDDNADSRHRTVSAVRAEVALRLCDGQPSLRAVARTLAVSTRTLQRQLHRHGVRFKTLVTETRHQLARQYLAGTDLSVTEIAFLLGYSELSVFDRAFGRAAGRSPSDWRRQNRAR